LDTQLAVQDEQKKEISFGKIRKGFRVLNVVLKLARGEENVPIEYGFYIRRSYEVIVVVVSNSLNYFD